MDPKAKSDNAVVEGNAPVRRPYSAPRLRQLGSVRELTLGGTMGVTEGGGTLIMTGKM